MTVLASLTEIAWAGWLMVATIGAAVYLVAVAFSSQPMEEGRAKQLADDVNGDAEVVAGLAAVDLGPGILGAERSWNTDGRRARRFTMSPILESARGPSFGAGRESVASVLQAMELYRRSLPVGQAGKWRTR